MKKKLEQHDAHFCKRVGRSKQNLRAIDFKLKELNQQKEEFEKTIDWANPCLMKLRELSLLNYKIEVTKSRNTAQISSRTIASKEIREVNI
jgi:hypothetical protein